MADARLNDTARILSRNSSELPIDYQIGRAEDLYVSLLAQLFRSLRHGTTSDSDWADLGNSLAQIGGTLSGTQASEAFLFGATSFYYGGLPAAAYLTIRRANPDDFVNETYRACYDFLARPPEPTSDGAVQVQALLRNGDESALHTVIERALKDERESLSIGPDEWISARIWATLLTRFQVSNLRSVLPRGWDSEWTPLVHSLLSRRPPVWDFFPSQIQAIESGLLDKDGDFTVQMPTGAGKTALMETLIYGHLMKSPDAVVLLLVPYRALARELRSSLGMHLRALGYGTRAFYGGSIPSSGESLDLDRIRLFIATPEAMNGVMAAERSILDRISMVICDEGHLLDSGERGVVLELLLARFLAHENGRPKMVFISAIAPNVKEISRWISGNESGVVHSDFKPSDVDFSVLTETGRGNKGRRVSMTLWPIRSSQPSAELGDFLTASDFTYTSQVTHRINTHNWSSFKARAVAAARKSLPLGTAAVFVATKRGTSGVAGVAQEFLRQVDHKLALPKPLDYLRDLGRRDEILEYLGSEYGSDWVGYETLKHGAVIHHGDLPQETREAIEDLVTDGVVPLIFCTSTLAEGVNLPIRTMVLYSITRRNKDETIPLKYRDVENLVGRVGRAKTATRGSVICANRKEWLRVFTAASGGAGEVVNGALYSFILELESRSVEFNELMSEVENDPTFASLCDGIDAALMEALHETLTASEFARLADIISVHTFAHAKLSEHGRKTLRGVFRARARQLLEYQSTGVLALSAATGVRPRVAARVARDVVPRLRRLPDSVSEGEVLAALVDELLRSPSAWTALQMAMPSRLRDDRDGCVKCLRDVCLSWMAGQSFREIASTSGLSVDEVLGLHSGFISYQLLEFIEEVTTVYQQTFDSVNDFAQDAVSALRSSMRYGTVNETAKSLFALGLRHRRAAVCLGNHFQRQGVPSDWKSLEELRESSLKYLEDSELAESELGVYVYRRTIEDLRNAPTGD